VLDTYHGISGRYVQEYLNEFCYRLNRALLGKSNPTAY
jgi:hypothetical protein